MLLITKILKAFTFFLILKFVSLCVLMTFSFTSAYRNLKYSQLGLEDINYLECDLSFASGLMQIVVHLLQVNTDIQGLLTAHSLRAR